MPSAEKRVFLDYEEWTELWVQKQHVLLRAAKKILRNEQDAKDALQKAFESLEKRMGRDGLGVKLQERKTKDQAAISYLIGVVCNHAINIARQPYRSKEIQEQPTADSSGGSCPEEELLFKSSLGELNNNCKGIAQTLPPVLKRLFLFICKYLDSYGPNEQWLLWAEENGIDAGNKQERNNFDQRKMRLCTKLRACGLYALLGGKE